MTYRQIRFLCRPHLLLHITYTKLAMMLGGVTCRKNMSDVSDGVEFGIQAALSVPEAPPFLRGLAQRG